MAVMQWDILLPSDFVGFTDAAGKYFSLLISGENFSGYWSAVGRVLGIIANSGILRDRRSKNVFHPEQLAEVVRDGQTKITARLSEAQIRLPEHRPEREENKRNDDRDNNVPTHPPALPCKSDNQ